jgi:hypothetical protein
MSDNKKAIRKALQVEIDERDDVEGELANGGIITKYVAVCEVMDMTGHKWLAIVTGDGADESIVRWDVQGILFSILHDPMWSSDG